MARKKPAVAEKKVEEVKETKVYKALVSFKDKDGSIVKSGEDYTSEDEEWIEYLLSDRNSQKKPIIESR